MKKLIICGIILISATRVFSQDWHSDTLWKTIAAIGKASPFKTAMPPLPGKIVVVRDSAAEIEAVNLRNTSIRQGNLIDSLWRAIGLSSKRSVRDTGLGAAGYDALNLRKNNDTLDKLVESKAKAFDQFMDSTLGINPKKKYKLRFPKIDTFVKMNNVGIEKFSEQLDGGYTNVYYIIFVGSKMLELNMPTSSKARNGLYSYRTMVNSKVAYACYHGPISRRNPGYYQVVNARVEDLVSALDELLSALQIK